MTVLHILLFVCLAQGSISQAPSASSGVNLPPIQYNGGVGSYSGGLMIQSRETPWHAGLYTKTTRPYKQICGGTVIAKHAILTAAHCFSQDRNIPPASHYAVAAGKIYRPFQDLRDLPGSQKSDVQAIHIPPRYQGSVANFQDDIAVVILANEFLYSIFLEKACLNFNPDFDEAQLWEGQLGKVVGWGLTGENSEASQVLQGGSLPSVNINKCIEESPVSFRGYITGDKICAGYNNGTAVCRGDSGGGIVFSETIQGELRHYLRGVVSTSPTTDNACNIYTWATFTHVLRHEHFIKSILPDIEKSCIESYEGLTQSASLVSTQAPGNDKYPCECPQTFESPHWKTDSSVVST